MRPSILHSVALGLAGLQAADASACKPRSLSSGVSTIASTTVIASETTSFGFSSESSVPSSSIVSASTDATTESTLATEATTTVAVTSTDVQTTDEASATETTIVTESVSSADVSTTTTTIATEADTTSTEETSSTIVSASTEVTSTAETTTMTETTVTTGTTTSTETTVSSETISISETTETPTSIHTTTEEATTTTTAELPVITDFEIKGVRAPVDGKSIYSDGSRGRYLLFPGPNIPSYYYAATFSVESTSGRLLIDDSLPVCAFFSPGLEDMAYLITCHDPPTSREAAITCTPPAKDGDVLSCSVPGMACVAVPNGLMGSTTTCTPTGETLSDTSTDYSYDSERNYPVIGHLPNGVNFAVHAV